MHTIAHTLDVALSIQRGCAFASVERDKPVGPACDVVGIDGQVETVDFIRCRDARIGCPCNRTGSRDGGLSVDAVVQRQDTVDAPGDRARHISCIDRQIFRRRRVVYRDAL